MFSIILSIVYSIVRFALLTLMWGVLCFLIVCLLPHLISCSLTFLPSAVLSISLISYSLTSKRGPKMIFVSFIEGKNPPSLQRSVAQGTKKRSAGRIAKHNKPFDLRKRPNNVYSIPWIPSYY